MDKKLWWAIVALLATATIDAAAVFWVTGDHKATVACFVLAFVGLLVAVGLSSRRV